MFFYAGSRYPDRISRSEKRSGPSNVPDFRRGKGCGETQRSQCVFTLFSRFRSTRGSPEKNPISPAPLILNHALIRPRKKLCHKKSPDMVTSSVVGQNTTIAPPSTAIHAGHQTWSCPWEGRRERWGACNMYSSVPSLEKSGESLSRATSCVWTGRGHAGRSL